MFLVLGKKLCKLEKNGSLQKWKKIGLKMRTNISDTFGEISYKRMKWGYFCLLLRINLQKKMRHSTNSAGNEWKKSMKLQRECRRCCYVRALGQEHLCSCTELLQHWISGVLLLFVLEMCLSIVKLRYNMVK